MTPIDANLLFAQRYNDLVEHCEAKMQSAIQHLEDVSLEFSSNVEGQSPAVSAAYSVYNPRFSKSTFTSSS